MTDVMKSILSLYGELTISPKGTSMNPYLKAKRDKVRVIPCNNAINVYDIVLYKNQGLYILHRVIGIEDDCFLICGDNNMVTERIRKDEIIGVVDLIIRGKRDVSPNDFSSKLWVFLWYRVNLKRYLFAIRNILRRLRKNF